MHVSEPTAPAPDKKGFVANPAEKASGAPLVEGNLPRSAEGGVHTMEDVERVHGFMDNTEVFRVMVDALGLGRSAPSSTTTTTAGTAGARK